MWERKFRGNRIHGGSTTQGRTGFPLRDFLYRGKHFAIETRLLYLHLTVHNSRHADRDPYYEMKGGGMPERFRGTISTSYALVIGKRFHTSHHFSFDYGRETLDWKDLEKSSHLRMHSEEAQS